MLVQPESGDDYVILDDIASSADHHRNRVFASELRRGYSQLLAEAAATDRLLDPADQAVNIRSPRRSKDAPVEVVVKPAQHDLPLVTTSFWIGRYRPGVDRSDGRRRGRQRRRCTRRDRHHRGRNSQDQSFDDLCDHFIEFREDNVNNPVAATLRYSLPAKQQSDVLKEQIEHFRVYRRERFRCFVEATGKETTIASNISALLRFLGYLFYEQEEALHGAPLDMTVFALDDINQLVLSYVEWLDDDVEKRAAQSDTSQPVSCATVADYLNGLISIVKFQLCDDLDRRDRLLDQLRNLRSQAESYSMMQNGLRRCTLSGVRGKICR